MGVRDDAELEGYVFRLLPDYVRSSDDGTLALFLGRATVASMGPALRTADVADPNTSVSGTPEIANPLAAPRSWLAWLGYLIGIDTSALADADIRSALQDASTSQRRGSTAAMRVAVQRTLTGGKSCSILTDDGGNPYAIRVIVRTAQMPSGSATLAAATSEKPAGCSITVQAAAGTTWQQITTKSKTWAQVAAVGTWDDVLNWTP